MRDRSVRAPLGSRPFWILAAASALLLLAPIREGDLPGYDDALYAQMAKGVVQSGDWLNIRSNGEPALEHPPLLVWTEAAFYKVFGFSDFLAKLPSALAGWGTILLVYWLALRLLGDRLPAVLAMFVMATSLYFLKYSARAMTDVPCTFLFTASICAWVRAQEDRRWYLVTGVVCGLAQMSRGMIGLALPVIFACDLLIRRRRPPVAWAAAALLLTFLPVTLWYWHTIQANRAIFADAESTFLSKAVFGELNPPWRRYTGAPEYLWMIAKSYWPWLPATVAGLLVVVRNRERRRLILAVWIAVVFLLCSAARSRVLRYMLPAYPAFSVLAAFGMCRFVAETQLRAGIRVLAPVFAVMALAVAVFPPVILHAREIKPIASTATAAVPPGRRVGFYDEGNARFDEANQLHWYGDRNLVMLFTPEQLADELRDPSTDVFIVDRGAYFHFVAGHYPNRVLQESGNLVCFRLS